MSQPLVVYRGPSMLDGAPIVVLATLGSKNVKTGPMVQTWILRSDMPPVEASQVTADSSVCGNCPRRQSLKGLRDILGKLAYADCYVLIHNGPQSTYKAWWRAGSPDADLQSVCHAIAEDAEEHGVRLGSYGDPAAVPFHVWRDMFAMLEGILGAPVRHTGYTHQWRATLFEGCPESYNHYQWCRDNLMASTDTPHEARQARASGWRYFLAMPDGTPPPERTVQCLADRDINPRTCEACGICDGAQGRANRASVYIAEHGARSMAKARRSAALAVLA